jgi:hypothetical protein
MVVYVEQGVGNQKQEFSMCGDPRLELDVLKPIIITAVPQTKKLLRSALEF